MSKDGQYFNILFRSPKYPLIVISGDSLMSAFNIKELAFCCVNAIPEEENGVVIAIDSSGEEFWYSPDNTAISPGFAFKRWTKKQIIELYNNSIIDDDQTIYSIKSISNKRLTQIVIDICNLIK